MAAQRYGFLASIVVLLMVPSSPSLAEQGQISEILLNLNTSINSSTRQPRAVQPSPYQRITVLEKRKRSGFFPRQRGPQIYRGCLLVVGMDKSGREIWRTVMADPRLIRAEIFDPHGKIAISREIYQKDIEFSVVLPDDPDMTSLKFYHPRWTGMGFDLQVIGEAELH